MRVRLACALLVAAATASSPGPARAHPQFAPTGSNRYLKITLLGKGGVRLAYTVLVGEVPALAARKAADANGDGTLDAAEQAAAAARLERLVDEGLLVEVDGARQRPRWEPPTAGFSTDTRVGPIPFSIDLVGRIEPGGGEHRLRLEDRTPLDALLETEIRLEEGPGTHLIGGWQGREDGGRQSRFLFQGPAPSALTDRSVGFRYVDASATRRRRPLPIALGAILVAAATAMLVLRRARRRG